MHSLARTLAPLAVALSLALSGCSSDAGKEEAAPPEQPQASETAKEPSAEAGAESEKEAIAAYQEWYRAAAYGKDPVKACSLMTEELGQEEVSMLQSSGAAPGTKIETCDDAIGYRKISMENDPGKDEPPASITTTTGDDRHVVLEVTAEGSEPSVITMQKQDDGTWLLSDWGK